VKKVFESKLEGNRRRGIPRLRWLEDVAKVKSEEVIPVQESVIVSGIQHEATVKIGEARDGTGGELINLSAPEDFRPHVCETSEAAEVSNEY